MQKTLQDQFPDLSNQMLPISYFFTNAEATEDEIYHATWPERYRRPLEMVWCHGLPDIIIQTTKRLENYHHRPIQKLRMQD